MKKIIIIIALISISTMSLIAKQKGAGGGISFSFETSLGHDVANCPGEDCYGISYGYFGHPYIGTYKCHIPCWGTGTTCKINIGIGGIIHQGNSTLITNLEQIDFSGNTNYIADFELPDYNEITFSFGCNRSYFIPGLNKYVNIINQIAPKETYDEGGYYYTFKFISFSNTPKY